jgi:hypothetical protein
MMIPSLVRVVARCILAASACTIFCSAELVAQPAQIKHHRAKVTECYSFKIRVLPPHTSMPDRYTEILSSRITERTGIKSTVIGKTACEIELGVREGIGREGFRIEDASGLAKIRIIGNDDRGLLYGIGKFLRSNTYRSGSFLIGNWRGTSVPKNDVRGIYFATHFHNYYNDAPVEDIRRYVEDLSLWGVNALSVAYDMHSFAGIEDPAAQAMLKRLHVILKTAKEVGMATGLMLGANQAYSTSPEELRAVGPGRGEFNATDLCPRKPGAKELLLKQFSQEFEAFADVGIDYVTIWPYDASGCGCELCRPWGGNGFLYIAEATARLARRYFPNIRVTLATWYFDQVEWERLDKAFQQKPDWVDYLLAEPLGHPDAYVLKHPSPGDLPLIGFPEISMAGMYPWGGFGANPQPARLQRDWNLVKERFRGGFPYSEGIYEDLNKVVFTQFYWDSERDAYDIIREYLAYELSASVATKMTGVIRILEQNHHYRWWPGGKRDYNFPGHELWWKPPKGTPRDVDTGEAWDIVQSASPQLSAYSRSSWRWRILYLRALLDDEFKRNEDRPTERAKEAIRELIEIYHASRADPAVKPSFQ